MRPLNFQIHRISNVSYQEVWDFQMQLHNDLKKAKSAFLTHNEDKSTLLNHIVLCEHKPVYTFGTSADEKNLQKTRKELIAEGFEIFDINRGGDVTYHGPGQITGYLILDLELLYRDIHRYVNRIELAIILLLRDYGMDPVRVEGYTGVWIEDGKGLRKICAIGVHLSRWVSLHGFGFNVCSELDHFKNIIPCGIYDQDKSVTSLSNELNRQVSIDEVVPKLLDKLATLFNMNFIDQK